ncbi:penicillin-binding transpeptidase domain-containing protein [Dactylosporangium sp. AC04546]|uniref:penicillin-binding transpeptidase domain-containing protein n=1 Tax=Dactylosporangium sp. AC04546 TaxID=2862460 RepID=UPI001EDE3A9C|nr:penicillin-binding transpeptidase domain-containing protein [Dactylosporangium sp. AC04546]WVK85124.1 penicillin-binding transpeptidase domain-containing protein [Dactylosporangium sp. AC04546]
MAVSLRRATALLAALALLGTLPACSSKPPDDSLKTFLGAWEQGNIAGLKFLSPDGKALSGDAAQKLLTTVEGDLAAQQPKLSLNGAAAVKGDESTAIVTVQWPVSGSTWEYDTTIKARRVDKQWTVIFSAKTIHPDLENTDKLAVKKTSGTRGSILDGAGQPIVSSKPVVTIGVEPRQVTDINLVVKNLGDAFAAAKVSVDLSTLPNKVKSAKPDAFVEIITLRKEVFDPVANKLNSTPGVVTRNSTQSLAPSAQFARALLGTSGQVTKEIMDKNPGKYKVGDVVGLSGLQQKYDEILQGKPGVSVVIPKPTGTPDVKLFSAEPSEGAKIKLTLDVNIQNAAEAALALDTRRSALVAIRISDNSIVAVANGPGAAGNNFALVGQTPPGSTFKTITALGALDKGLTGDSIVACPKTLTVDGRTFRNSHDMELGNVPLHTDFAKSCNTAFASLAPQLGPDGLAKTAQSVGIGIPWDLGVDVFTGKVSANGSKSEQAAAAFGQGTTLASPVILAGAAAAVARGQWKQPQLVLDPAPKSPAADGPQLNPASLEALRQMMREVVTGGTADQLKNLPGDLRGKTGTAEYDNDPAHTHSWFMGYRGDIAFCVFVENGGASTAAAVPIAGKFFQTIG